MPKTGRTTLMRASMGRTSWVSQQSSTHITEPERQKAIVRFGSEADICSAKRHVCFTPDNDRESGFPHKVMSALPPKADMCSALAYVCFGPQADIGAHSITSSARAISVGGISRPSAFAALKLITSSYLVGACTGRSAGFSPLRTRST
jgi:hypothetical protein